MGRPRSEIAFGSDSFLDVIANLVGILIILTVIAGLRVSRSPVIATPAPTDATPAPAVAQWPAVVVTTEQQSIPVAPFDPESLIPPRADEPKTEPVAAPRAPRSAPAPSPDLLKRIADLKAELAALKTGADGQAVELRDVAAQEQALRGRLGENLDALATDEQDVEKGEQLLRGLHGRVTESQIILRNLEDELEQARQQAEPVKALRHRMTPLAREVHGKEYHFLLTGGRVAHIPIDELVERIRVQVLRQRDWLMKFPKHQGMVGPIEGFSMNYVVERTELTFAERMRSEPGVMKIAVSRWTLRPEPDLMSESMEDALQPTSSFISVLRRADLDSTLTFWVYPDSFPLYRQLAEVCHREGFTVAARPMPFGVEIAGSPNGTRSSGQ